MVLAPAPHRHELDNTIHATFLFTTARLHPFSMQLPAVQEGQSMPETVLLRQQHGSWERTRRAPRPQQDGGDARRAMLPDHATKLTAKKEYYRLSSTCGAPRNQRSARGCTRLTTVTSISCRSF